MSSRDVEYRMGTTHNTENVCGREREASRRRVFVGVSRRACGAESSVRVSVTPHDDPSFSNLLVPHRAQSLLLLIKARTNA